MIGAFGVLALSWVSPEEAALRVLRERLELASLVAHAKLLSGQPVDDPPREAVILDSVVAEARRRGYDQAAVRDLFARQIEANKMAQRELLTRWRRRPPVGPAPDLGRDVRPRIDQITTEILGNWERFRPRTGAAGIRWQVAAERLRPPDSAYWSAWQLATEPQRQIPMRASRAERSAARN